MGYSRRAFVGASWMTAFRLVSRAIAFVRIYILARLLIPSQFGIFGIASLILIFLETLTETGMNVFLIQEKDDVERYIDTGWIVSIIRGFLMAIIIASFSHLISQFYNAPGAYSVLIIASLVPLIRGFINPSVARFQKELNFNKEFYYRSSIFLVESLATITIVFINRSPAGLVFGLVTGALFEVILSFVIVKPTPHLVFDKGIFSKIISRGKWVTFSGIFSYLFQNGDNIVVGKAIGTSALGIYDMTYRVAILPVTEIADVITKVAFPVYVKISHDNLRLKRAFLKTLIIISLISIPIGLIFFLFPRQIILLLLGEKWLEAVPVLQVLAIFGMIRAISGVASPVFLSVQKQEYSATVMLVSFLGMAIAILPLINIFGLIGAGLAALVGVTFSLPIIIYFLLKIFK